MRQAVRVEMLVFLVGLCLIASAATAMRPRADQDQNPTGAPSQQQPTPEQPPEASAPQQTPPVAEAPSARAPINQPPYEPKFTGDPSRSESESQALGYMRTVLRAQKVYKQKHDHYAASLMDLATHGGMVTKRMARTTDRGDYVVGFQHTDKSHKKVTTRRAKAAKKGPSSPTAEDDGYILALTPKNLDATHRSFYAEEDGKIHADETKPAGPDSPVLR